MRNQDRFATSKVVVENGTDTYVCISSPGTPATTAAWMCRKITTTGTTTFADGNDNYDNLASDPVNLTYS